MNINRKFTTIFSISKIIAEKFKNVSFSETNNHLQEKVDEVYFFESPIVNKVITGRNTVNIEFNNSDMAILISYDKPIAILLNRNKPSERLAAYIKGEKFSPTTKKHLKEFFINYGWANYEIEAVDTTESEIYYLMAGK